MEQIQNVTVQEGSDVTEECKGTSGTPNLTVFWENVNTGEVRYGKLLNITNIGRNQRGEYRCFANNSSGSDFTTTFIDVQCKDIYVTSFFFNCLCLLCLVFVYSSIYPFRPLITQK